MAKRVLTADNMTTMHEKHLEATAERYGLSLLVSIPNNIRHRLVARVYHDEHDFCVECKVPHQATYEQLVAIVDTMCDQWHRATTRH